MSPVFVVLCVVATVAVFEMLLPRAWSAWLRWQESRTVESAMEGVLPASETEVPAPPVQPVAEVRAPEPKPPEPVVVPPPVRPAEPPKVERSVDTANPEELWALARQMTHGIVPDPTKDGEYLSLVYRAAKLGHHKAMVKLGDYAYRRGAIVEAYYWTALAELKGARGLDTALREMKTRWLSEGCPPEYRNAYDGFSETQGSFARALLRIRCAVETPLARARMKELAEQGCEEARLFLAR